MINANDVLPLPEEDGAEVLDAVEAWLGRFIAVTEEIDLALLAIWIVSTHMAEALYTSPRIQLDSTMPGSGKTTVLDHMYRLCHDPLQVASLSSAALLPRLLESGVRTILLDEVDRSLRPDKPDVQDLIAILNSGYRRGATRPVLVHAPGGQWTGREMSTFAPVAMAGNSPRLPDDTKSRSVRILLTPDLDGTVEDSDWEHIEDDAAALKARVVSFAESARDRAAGLSVDLPAGCMGRSREKWRPLKRVAVLAGGRWPEVADQLARRDKAEDEARREAGLRELPDGLTVLMDLRAIWPEGESFVSTAELLTKLIAYNQERWGVGSSYGKTLTGKRLGLLLEQAAKVTSMRPGGRGLRGYQKDQLQPWWDRHRIATPSAVASGASGESGESGSDRSRMNRLNRVHRDEPQLSRDAEGQQQEGLEGAEQKSSSTLGVTAEDQLRGGMDLGVSPQATVSSDAPEPSERYVGPYPEGLQQSPRSGPPTPLVMPRTRTQHA